MKLEIGKRYRNGRGQIEDVMGYTRGNLEWVWTLQGNWYRESDGRFIMYGQFTVDGEKIWEHRPSAPTGRDLIEEVEETT